jgi:hypothetical protein
MMKRVVQFFRNLDVILTVRALLFTVVAAVVIGIFVLSLQIERFIKFLHKRFTKFLYKFDAILVWSLLIVCSWAVFIVLALFIISLV